MQTLHQRSVLTFWVADDNIIVRHEERIADLTLCAEGFTGTGSAQNPVSYTHLSSSYGHRYLFLSDRSNE